MDTKSKNNKWLGLFLSVILILVMGITWSSITYRMAETVNDAELGDSVVSMLTEQIVRDCYTLNYQLGHSDTAGADPASYFAPQLHLREDELMDALDDVHTSQDDGDTTDSADPEQDLLTELDALTHAESWLNSYIISHDNAPLKNLLYFAEDTKTNAVLSNAGYELERVMNSQDDMLYNFPFIVGLSFDASGKVSVWDHPNIVRNEKAASASAYACRSLTQMSINTRQELNDILDGYFVYTGQSISPRSMNILFAVPSVRSFTDRDILSQQILYSHAQTLREIGYTAIFYLAAGLAVLFGFAMGLVKKWSLGNLCCIRSIPFEVSVLLLLLIPGIEAHIRHWIADPVSRFSFIPNLLLLLLILSITYSIGLTLSPISSDGSKAYFHERSLCVRYWPQLRSSALKLWHACAELDLSIPHRKAILKFTVLNGIILIAAWFLSPLGMILYSILLFFFLDKRYRKVQAQYQALLDAAHHMAEGHLDTDIQEEAGPFTDLRNELTDIRQGFRKAVDAEVKSQSMKTELITNVSHDLKTPLTAIITYVDLLKREDITDEERRSYIDTLDRKSQRLKQLIADLFDVSKAASRDMTPDLVPLDLAALLKQVRSELGDKLDAADLDFRWNIPEERVPVLLDGRRTYRVFENLLINIVKYAMPGTRAYIDITPSEDQVSVSFKNISAAELDLNGRDLTERFVRGDASRSTEGSGLGLAIVKSFVELQNGSFHIDVDGDLFKAQILWPLYHEEISDIPFDDN